MKVMRRGVDGVGINMTTRMNFDETRCSDNGDSVDEICQSRTGKEKEKINKETRNPLYEL